MSRHSCGLGRDEGVQITKGYVEDRLLDDYEVARITGRARSTLQKDRTRGTGIPYVRIGALVRYRASDLAAFLDSLPRFHSTSERDES